MKISARTKKKEKNPQDGGEALLEPQGEEKKKAGEPGGPTKGNRRNKHAVGPGK